MSPQLEKVEEDLLGQGSLLQFAHMQEKNHHEHATWNLHGHQQGKIAFPQKTPVSLSCSYITIHDDESSVISSICIIWQTSMAFI